MHRKGFIHQETIFPEDSIPIDVEESTWVKLTIPELCYRDIEFSCRDCGKNETWQAHEQQFYFEVIKASPHARPVRCYACRKIERERKNEARRRAGHLEK
ncbi:MAG: zinc-ribbon domain containing protein [Verrucomicrobiota bacterium]